MDSVKESACVGFRVAAGPDVGLGHLQRCLSLAMALHQQRVNPVFFIGTNAAADRIRHFNFPFRITEKEQPGENGDLEETLRGAREHGCQTMVVDSYQVDSQYLGSLRAAGLAVIAIDDLAREAFPCQMVVNGSVHAGQMPYRSSSGDTRFLLGPQYALLSREFWEPSRRVLSRQVQNLLVTVGGTDSHGLMPRLLKWLDKVRGDFKTTAVLGPFFKNHREIAQVARECRHPVQIVEAPERMCDLMREADLAISAGGQTLYELAAVGTPTVAVQVADNQAGNLEALAGAGVVKYGGCAGEKSLREEMIQAVQERVGHFPARVEMSERGQRLIDGGGALRVAGEWIADGFSS